MGLHSVANDAFVAVIFWVTFYFWFFVFETWVGLHSKPSKVSSGNVDRRSAFFLLVALYAGIFLAVMFAFFEPGYKILRIETDFGFFMFAILLIWYGMLLRFWSIWTLGTYFRTLVLIHNDHKLITSGPYRYLRHPSYTGSILSVTGVGLALGNWMSLGSVILCACLGYVWRIRVEESALQERFGTLYDEYKKRSWRIIPYIW